MTAPADWPATRALTLGWAGLVVLVFGFGGWSTLTSISGAIVVSGQLDVERGRQSVQHSTGGVVTDVYVAEGDSVAAGQMLLRLDGLELKSDLAVAQSELSDLRAQRTRLEAERDGNTAMPQPRRLNHPTGGSGLPIARPPELAQRRAQERIFQARADSFRAEHDQLDRRRDQIRDQAHGLDAQIAASAHQLALTLRELTDQRALLDRGLTVASRVLDLDRETARLEGVVGGLEAARAEAESRVTETGLAILQLISDRREQALDELRAVVARETDLAERARTLRRKIDALDIRAPISGIVLGLQLKSPGSVMAPTVPALYIIPQDRPFVVEARISSLDVDEVAPGQSAILRMVGYNSGTTADILGNVSAVSADALFDQSHAIFYYQTEIEIPAIELKKLGTVHLVPGMPVEVFLRTRNRTPLSYLVEPFRRFFDRAFRES